MTPRRAQRVVAVRHPPVALSGVCYGALDVPAPASAAELAALLDALGGWRFDVVTSSPARRCLDVATYLAEQLSLPLHVDPRLSELNFGAWEGRRWQELEEQSPTELARWMADWQRLAPPGGETLGELQRRVAAGLQALATRSAAPLLLTHAGVLRCLRRWGDGSAWPDVMGWSVPHLKPLELPLQFPSDEAPL